MVRPSDALKGAAGPAPSASGANRLLQAGVRAGGVFRRNPREKSTQNALLQESFESIR